MIRNAGMRKLAYAILLLATVLLIAFVVWVYA